MPIGNEVALRGFPYCNGRESCITFGRYDPSTPLRVKRLEVVQFRSRHVLGYGALTTNFRFSMAASAY